MRFLPSAKESRWFIWMGIYALALWLLFILHRFVVLGQTFDAILLLRLALFSLAVSAVLNTFGWLGARLVWLIATTGVTIGLILMFAYTFRDMSGWQDLAGFLAFSLFTVGGFALGLVAEGVAFWLKWRKTR
jgi:hypothetical protein